MPIAKIVEPQEEERQLNINDIDIMDIRRSDTKTVWRF